MEFKNIYIHLKIIKKKFKKSEWENLVVKINVNLTILIFHEMHQIVMFVIKESHN